MKDFLGNKLAIGDNVITTPKGYRGLVKAKVIAFTPKKVRVVYTAYGLGRPAPEEFLTDPTSLVKF